MTEFKVVEVDGDRENGPFSTRAEAQEHKEHVETELGLDVEIESVESNGGSKPNAAREAEVVANHSGDIETSEDAAQAAEKQLDELSESDVAQGYSESEPVDLPNNPDIRDDPVDWLPDHFIDHIQGVPTVNRKGYAVIASRYGVSATAEPVTLASETDFEYAEFRAIAEKNGQEYSGFGSAHVDRMDGDDKYLLNELAETRALKRAVSWASGVGLTAASEMMGELE